MTRPDQIVKRKNMFSICPPNYSKTCCVLGSSLVIKSSDKIENSVGRILIENRTKKFCPSSVKVSEKVLRKPSQKCNRHFSENEESLSFNSANFCFSKDLRLWVTCEVSSLSPSAHKPSFDQSWKSPSQNFLCKFFLTYKSNFRNKNEA